VISPTQRPLLDKTQQSKETNIHAPAGFEINNPSKNRFSYYLKFRACEKLDDDFDDDDDDDDNDNSVSFVC
jgi:hypothetical protein